MSVLALVSTLTVNIGSTANAFVTSLTTSGGGDTINIASVPVLTGYPKQFPIIQYSSSIPNGGGFDFRPRHTALLGRFARVSRVIFPTT